MMIQAIAGAFALVQSAEPAPADGAEPPDPCRFGPYGPAAELIDTAPVEIGLEGFETYEGEVPTADIIDPCGLRFADLSGVWAFNGLQTVAYHDLRTGEFSMRFTHIPYDHPFFDTWAIRFGDPAVDGFIAPEAQTLQLTFNSIYPPNVEATCPDRYRRRVDYIAIALSYDDAGRVVLTGARPRARIDAQCVETFIEFETDTIVRTGVEGAAP